MTQIPQDKDDEFILLFLSVLRRSPTKFIALMALIFSAGWSGAKLITPPAGVRERAAVEEAFRQNRVEIPERSDLVLLIQDLSKSLSMKAQSLESEADRLKRRIKSIEAGKPCEPGLESEIAALRSQSAIKEERVNELKAEVSSCMDNANKATESERTAVKTILRRSQISFSGEEDIETLVDALASQCQEQILFLKSQVNLLRSKTDQRPDASPPAIYFWWGEGMDYVRRCEKGGREIMTRFGLSTNLNQGSTGDLLIWGGVGDRAALAVCGRDMKMVGLAVAGKDTSEFQRLAAVLVKEFFNRDD